MSNIRFRAFGFLCIALTASLFIGACRNEDTIKKQRIEKADRHFQEISERVFPAETIFTLPLCIEAALKNNLDLKVYDLKETIAKENRTAEILGMLPELNVREDLTQRNNEPGSSSQSLSTGDQSLVPSKSSDKGESYTKVELVLSTLDFGLAYFNSMQADDKVFLEGQQKRRTAQNLVVDVVSAYFRVAAAQYAVEKTERLLKMCDDIDNTLITLTKNKTISPLRGLDERKRFITVRKRLMEYRRSYENSCVELRALMGYLPLREIKVDTKCLAKLNVIDVPNIDILTRIALKERPELYQLDLQEHITILEARKAILMMFPNVRIFADFNYSTNSFLYNQSWWEVGMRAAYNLLKLPAQIKRYQALDKQIDEVTLRTLSMTIGVMAQVRIAQANMLEVKERYELDEKVHGAYKAHLEFARQNAGIIGKISPLEINRLELETAETAIERAQSLSNYYLSYYRLLNTVGVEAIDQTQIEETVKKLTEQVEKEAQEEKNASAVKPSELEEKFLKDNMIYGMEILPETGEKISPDKKKKLSPKPFPPLEKKLDKIEKELEEEIENP
ncbi:MAG: hypothetical protein A2017_15995 [Lentisphaerae bacterium GWF2_44_16]|nr:MAG: hypothetical protein A2017_15995 [Lentisphaerae bacterium GWF2_44_16]